MERPPGSRRRATGTGGGTLRRPLTTAFLALVVVVVLLLPLLLPPAFAPASATLRAAAIIPGQEFYLSEASFGQESPVICETKVVWSQVDGPAGVFSLCVYDLETGLKQTIAQAPSPGILHYALSPTHIVWQTYLDDYYNSEVRVYEFATQQQRRLPALDLPVGMRLMDTQGDRIVYAVASEGDDSSDLWLYNISTGQKAPLCTALHYQGGARIHGNVVAWSDRRNLESSEMDVYAYDLGAAREIAVCTDPGVQSLVGVYDDQVVWIDDQAGILCAYDIGTGQRWTVCAKFAVRGGGDVADGKVVCGEATEASGWASTMYIHDLTSGAAEQEVCPDARFVGPSLSGNTVVWRDTRAAYEVPGLRYGAILAYSSEYTEHAPPRTTVGEPVPDHSYPHVWNWSKTPFTLIFSESIPNPARDWPTSSHGSAGAPGSRGLSASSPHPQITRMMGPIPLSTDRPICSATSRRTSPMPCPSASTRANPPRGRATRRYTAARRRS